VDDSNTSARIIISTDSFIVLNLNSKAEEILGLNLPEVKGRSVLGLLISEQQEDFRKTLQVAGRHSTPPILVFSWKSVNSKNHERSTPLCLQARERMLEHGVPFLELTLHRKPSEFLDRENLDALVNQSPPLQARWA
jgi:hypothetical protein